MREINVSRAGDPVHAGDKALTRETPAKRGRVNRYVKTIHYIYTRKYKHNVHVRYMYTLFTMYIRKYGYV